ncbi:hypothetical protein K5_069 [Pseudomonas phage K5]|uniref:Cyanophage baseplate Pam3 plug gp18 domain-containing protein n=10 Tax=Viruses TaxID=10239 RepID=A0A410T859_9CAUD|nr:virion structural protein [Pseudomonas phage PaP1]YP_008859231.1 virion structural protein [Pseudomonas phage PAK_P4]YP_009200006.1 virion structural protein [Pseudomonas phage K8]YP_009273824.1 virion structural protein [Pseudomonas phage K5]YP_009598118.1 virion structural protein [Pseudomonas phage Zigelbrucke]YP_010762959.1 hypothetical protein QE327_gp115 [Pseudomonas phage Henu5]YP_010763887.1 hypothetical protein QE332_gp154 [Pseudomonas phage vB_PaeM_LCK69]YP_010764052.1 virion st
MSTTYIDTLPLYQDRKYRYAVAIEGISRVLQFYWNSRSRQWHMDIFDEELTPILTGLAVVPQYPIMADYAMQHIGFNGYFLLMPVNLEQVQYKHDASDIVPQFFELLYVNVDLEDDVE